MKKNSEIQTEVSEQLPARNVAVPGEVHARMKRYSEVVGPPLTWIVTRAIQEYLDRVEDERGSVE